MRFNVELLLENDIFPKDKNRIILSLIKHNFNSYDMEELDQLLLWSNLIPVNCKIPNKE